MLESARGGSGFRKLAGDLVGVFQRGVDRRLPDGEFEALALRVFRYQLAHNEVYRRFCEGRGLTGEGVTTWSEIPPVPTRAFKHLDLLSSPEPREVDAVFLTSGTSGTGARGRHLVPDLGLYRAAALPNFAAHLLPEALPDDRGEEPFRIVVLALLSAPEEAPESSLSAMAGFVVESWGAEGSGWFVDPEDGLEQEAFDRALERAASTGDPVLILGTAFSFVHWLDRSDCRVALPDGSRAMETGGFKGRSRSVSRDALYRALEERLGLAPSRIVNEYGMTELLSQFYEPVLRGDVGASSAGGAVLAERHLVAPPWVRTRVLDPETLTPLPDGRRGLLCHFDLANAGSVARVLTEDVGVHADAGFRVLGRASGSEPRGCSLAVEELMEASRVR